MSQSIEHSHCCEQMHRAVSHRCIEHPNRFDCPDCLVDYTPKFDEYGLIIHDGGSSVIGIQHCPWCGSKLPDSKRDRWFDELEALGITDPHEENVPNDYLSDKWYRCR